MRIIYLDIDSLRPDHLGCYGYHRATSPTIDAIAAEGLRCTNVYCSDAPCLPSRTAFYCGRFGIQTGVVGHGGTAAQPRVEGASREFADRLQIEGFAWQLQKAGFHTAMISPFGQRHSAHWFYAGFNEMHNTGQYGMESAEHVTPTVMKWLEDHAADDDWYLHINYWDVHMPYRAPLEYGEPFADAPLPSWLDDDEVIHRHNLKTGPHSSLDLGMYTAEENPRYPRQPARIVDRPSLRRVIDGYDTAIRYVDDQVARIVAALRAVNVYDDTAIIISADHGENLGELGIYGEHGTADDATCHVPLIIKWPENPGSAPARAMGTAPGRAKGAIQRRPASMAGAVDEGFHYHLDVAPTVMELLGKESPSSWDGRSFAQSVVTEASCGRDELVVSQCSHVCQRSVRFDRWLYIRTYHDGFHLFPPHMLFDLAEDPHEQTDIAASSRGICLEAAWRLQQWHDAQMLELSRTANDVVDPLWTVMREGGPYHTRGQLEGYIVHLERTGRASGAAALRMKYPASA